MQLQTNDFIADLERWRDAYISRLKAAEYSQNTIELYGRALEQFIEYSLQYQDEMTLRDLRSVYFDGFVNYLEEEARLKGMKAHRDGRFLSKSTKDTYLKAVKGCFKYISENNDDEYSFERFLSSYKSRDKTASEDKIDYLTEHEQELLEAGIEKDKTEKNYTTYRNAFLIKLMLYGGLRISEALGVRLSDIKEGVHSYIITIYAKGGKTQKARILKEYIEDELYYFVNISHLEDNEIIMKTRNNTQMTRFNASKTINKLYMKYGILKQGLHILRHTFAMRLTEYGAALVEIKDLLRHSNISTTTIYSKASGRSLDNALKRLSTKKAEDNT